MPHARTKPGLSLLEVVAAVAILGVLAVIALPRTNGALTEGKRASCFVQRAEIELQAMRWRRATSSWPATTLSDIAIDPAYFPEGVPTCPVDSSAYSIDAATGLVVGHTH
ncbi:MAG: type II secretion system protein [Planctomycetota bacterium]